MRGGGVVEEAWRRGEGRGGGGVEKRWRRGFVFRSVLILSFDLRAFILRISIRYVYRHPCNEHYGGIWRSESSVLWN